MLTNPCSILLSLGSRTELLRVPLRLAIADRLLIGLDGATPAPAFAGAPWQATLAQRLESDDVAKAWQPWLEVLPTGVQGLQHEGVAHELQYAPAVAALQTIRSERAELGAQLAAAPEDGLRFERGVSLAHTRAFLLELMPSDPWASCHAFVPLMDLFNHASEAESSVSWTIEDAGEGGGGLCMVATARRRVASGDQLTLAYEPTATNDDFCLYHGFVPASNEFDDVELFSSMPDAIAWHRQTFSDCSTPSDEIAAAATMLAELPALEGTVRMRRVGVASAGLRGAPLWISASEVDPRLLAAFRLLAAEIHPTAAEPTTGDEDGAVEPGRHAADALARRCEEMLRFSFATSLSDDLATLAALGTSGRACTAAEVNAALPAVAEGSWIAAAAPASAEEEPDEQDDALLLCTLAEALRTAAAGDGDTEAAGREMEVALRYRAGKKLVLHAAIAECARRRSA